MAVFTTLFVFALLQMCEAGGKFQIKLKRFTTACREHGEASKCDIYFKFCLEKPGVDNCNYMRAQTGVWEDTSTIDFGSNMKGVTNPMEFTQNVFESNTVDFAMEVWDEDMWTSDDHEGTLTRSLTYRPVLFKYLSENSWNSDYFFASGHHLWLAYRSYCDTDYYTNKCNVYCKAQDSDYFGHYTCDEETGNKICNPGWKGSSCLEDINECEKEPCYNHGTCINLPGSFQCTCSEHFTGRYCEQIASLCHSSPCRNGGTCHGNRTAFTCTCPPAWTGLTCEEQVNFCNSNPCHNNATCYGSLGNYTCVCDAGWDGPQCQTEVNACDSSPCQNGASCTNLPGAQYKCACPPEYEGGNCETEKNPCDPNPCQNSGVCHKLTYDTFNCSCVTGWSGVTCSEYIVVENEAQTGQSTQGSSDGGFDWWIILLACLVVLVLAVVIIFAIFIRRRRRRKAEKAVLMSSQHGTIDVIQVAGPDRLAFQNALYDRTNRENTQRDRQNVPVPPTPTRNPSDVFYPTKPKQLPDEELGAVGGAPNPYTDIGDGYLEPAKLVRTGEKATDTRQKQTAGGGCGLDTCTEAGAESKPAANHYADFDELKRRSIAARQGSDISNPHYDTLGDGVADPEALQGLQEEEEAHHYHELDDVILQIQNGETSASFSPAGACGVAPSITMNLPARTPPEELDTTDEEDEGAAGQEDIDALRREVLQARSADSQA